MKKLLSMLLCLTLVVALCACGSGGQSSSSTSTQTSADATSEAPATEAPTGTASEFNTDEIEEMSISMGDPATTGTFLTNNAQFFADTVRELSGGKIQIEVYADGLLGTEEALMNNIQIGAVEMANFSSTFTNLVSRAGLFDFPYFVTDRSQLDLLEEAGVIDEIRKEAEGYNIKIIAMNENGFRQITNNVRPIVEPEDLAGIVIRTPSNSLRVKTFETFGASPVAISFSELYQSLSQGICQAQENPVSQVISAQFYDYQPYLAISNHVYTPGWICMNLDLYNSLSDAQRAVIDRAGELTTEHVRETAADYDAQMLQECIDKGMEITYVDEDAFRAAVMPLWDEFAADVGGDDFVNMAKAALGY